jgi:hypothetical protein
MAFLERADSRADDYREIEEATGVPSTRLDRRSAGAQLALLDRWEALGRNGTAHVAAVPATRGAEVAAERAAETLNAASRAHGREVVVHAAAGPGHEPSGESVSLSSDVTVLVARKGERLKRVAARLAELNGLGIDVERTLMTTRGFRPTQAAAPVGDAAPPPVAVPAQMDTEERIAGR